MKPNLVVVGEAHACYCCPLQVHLHWITTSLWLTYVRAETPHGSNGTIVQAPLQMCGIPHWVLRGCSG